MSLTTNTEASLIKSIRFFFPHFLDPNKNGSVLKNFLTVIAYAFNINTQQLNEMFTNTFIMEAEGDKLTELIMQLTKIKRKNNETDADYRERYKKYVYQYNITDTQVKEIVNDITGIYPEKIVEGNNRGFYWGVPNNENITDTPIDRRYYYNDTNPDYTPLWGSNGDKAWTAYIYLKEIPPTDQLNELMDVIERVRMRGTIIYLVLPSINYNIFNFSNTIGSGNFIDEINAPQNNLIIVPEETIFEFGMRNSLGDLNDDTSNNNDAQIIEYFDEFSIFTWVMDNILLNDLTTNGNNGILVAIAYTDFILESIFHYSFDANVNPVQDNSLANNDAIIDIIPDPMLIFSWGMEG